MTDSAPPDAADDAAAATADIFTVEIVNAGLEATTVCPPDIPGIALLPLLFSRWLNIALR
jgi:hypothetical protein